MSQKRRRVSPEWAWEQALIDAYDDYRWHQVLDPLAAAVNTLGGGRARPWGPGAGGRAHPQGGVPHRLSL